MSCYDGYSLIIFKKQCSSVLYRCCFILAMVLLKEKFYVHWSKWSESQKDLLLHSLIHKTRAQKYHLATLAKWGVLGITVNKLAQS